MRKWFEVIGVVLFIAYTTMMVCYTVHVFRKVNDAQSELASKTAQLASCNGLLLKITKGK